MVFKKNTINKIRIDQMKGCQRDTNFNNDLIIKTFNIHFFKKTGPLDTLIDGPCILLFMTLLTFDATQYTMTMAMRLDSLTESVMQKIACCSTECASCHRRST